VLDLTNFQTIQTQSDSLNTF